MLYIRILSNKFDLKRTIRVLHKTFLTQIFKILLTSQIYNKKVLFYKIAFLGTILKTFYKIDRFTIVHFFLMLVE